MNKNVPDIENVTDADSDEYGKLKRLISDFKKGKFRSDISMGFSIPGQKEHMLECSTSAPAVKAALIIAAVAVSLIALAVFHCKMFVSRSGC